MSGQDGRRWHGGSREAAAPRHILFVKLKHIGDVLLMTPSIRAAREAWPTSAIAALVPRGTEEILADNPDLDAVFVLDRAGGLRAAWRTLRDLRRFAPDLVLEMGQGDREAVFGWLSGARERAGYTPDDSHRWRRRLLTRMVPWDGREHVVETNLDLLRALGIPARASRPFLAVHPEIRARMAADLRNAGLRPGSRPIVVHAVSRWMFKAWPRACCAETIAALVRDGLSVVLTSGPGADEVGASAKIREQAGVPVIDLAGRTNLRELAAVLAEARLFLGVDSAPMHMAAALGVPVVALFGPSGEQSWGPWGDGHAVVTRPFRCRPCGQDGCMGSKQSQCLEAIRPEDVLVAVERLLGLHIKAEESAEARGLIADP